MNTEWIKYKEVCCCSVNRNFMHPYQNIVVKEAEPYSLFLCPEDFSTQNQMDIRKRHLSKRGIWVSRSALQEESPAQRGRSCPSASWVVKAVAGRESPLATLGTSCGAPAFEPARLQPSRALALPAVAEHRKTMGFLLENTSNIKKIKWQTTASTS